MLLLISMAIEGEISEAVIFNTYDETQKMALNLQTDRAMAAVRSKTMILLL